MNQSNPEQLISEQAATIADQMNKIAQWAKSEEDVRHECNTLIDEFVKKANLKIKGRHEYGLAGGRIDSKYAGVILEYKDPKGAGRITEDPNSPGTQAVVKQIKRRFVDFEREEHIPPEKLFGVGIDGNTIVFVRQHGGKLEVDDPKPTTRYTIERLLRALISLGAHGKPFTPDYLAEDFGSDSPVAQKGVQQLYETISKTTSPKAQTFFGQWKILFGEVCGYNIEVQNAKVKKLGDHYGLSSTVRPAELLFAIHSYYGVFIKFLAAEIVSSFSPLGASIVKKCLGAPTSAALKREMEQLEQGGIWNQLGITNFLEGDLFSWYLAAWDENVAEVVRDLVKQLDEYDPRTLSVEPEESRDLLKKLYQQLFPKSVRHDLGEYYTPDWLAEHVLDKLGYTGDPDKRLLDPACGSGTFLVVAINRIKRWFDEHRHECGYGEVELVQKILKNVIGFDLNPLAVMAARTNFLIALRDLLPYTNGVELPIYLCDSIMTPAEYGGLLAGSLGNVKHLKTAAGEFLIPAEVVTNQEGISKYAEQLERCVRDEYTPDEFIDRCKEEGIPLEEKKLHRELYMRLQVLDKGNQNGIWARIIKNAFAPLFIEKVDYIAGNPPWVNWQNLPEDYRQDIAPLWQEYDLFRHKGYKAKLGGGKDDISVLMTYVAHDNYLRDRGSLGFVITQSVFKTKGGGEGFRTFQYQKGKQTVHLYVVHVDDMSSLQPFEGATNRTAVFVCEKSQEKFEYPVQYTVWKKVQRGRISQDMPLSGVLEATKRQELTATPVNKHQITSPWLTAPEEALPGIQKVIGQSEYKAYEGVNSGGLNGCYWIRILERLPSGDLLIENLHNVGKKKVEKVQMAIEPDLVYPLLRGRDVQRWKAVPSTHIILANRTDKLAGIPEETMKRKYPKTYAYFKRFEKELRNRSGYKQYFKPTAPFWSMYNVGPYTMSPWKVVWKEQSSRLQVAATAPENERSILPDHKLMLVPCINEDTAWFITGALSSSPAVLAVASYVLSTSTSTHVLENVAIPVFNPSDSVHQGLASLSQRCHNAVAEKELDSVTAINKAIDEAAAQLWGITNKELRSIHDALKEI